MVGLFFYSKLNTGDEPTNTNHSIGNVPNGYGELVGFFFILRSLIFLIEDLRVTIVEIYIIGRR